MKTTRLLLAVALAPLALTACGDNGEPDAAGTQDSAAVDAAPEAAPSEIPTPSPLPSEIPVALQGRWGMVPADCTSTMGDAKGLLTISDTKLEFYESVGTLGAVSDAGPARIRATFAFSGEGMNWTRDVMLEAQDDGKVLERREYGTDAEPGPFRYTRCE